MRGALSLCSEVHSISAWQPAQAKHNGILKHVTTNLNFLNYAVFYCDSVDVACQKSDACHPLHLELSVMQFRVVQRPARELMFRGAYTHPPRWPLHSGGNLCMFRAGAAQGEGDRSHGAQLFREMGRLVLGCFCPGRASREA